MGHYNLASVLTLSPVDGAVQHATHSHPEQFITNPPHAFHNRLRPRSQDLCIPVPVSQHVECAPAAPSSQPARPPAARPSARPHRPRSTPSRRVRWCSGAHLQLHLHLHHHCRRSGRRHHWNGRRIPQTSRRRLLLRLQPCPPVAAASRPSGRSWRRGRAQGACRARPPRLPRPSRPSEPCSA